MTVFSLTSVSDCTDEQLIEYLKHHPVCSVGNKELEFRLAIRAKKVNKEPSTVTSNAYKIQMRRDSNQWAFIVEADDLLELNTILNCYLKPLNLNRRNVVSIEPYLLVKRVQ